MADIELVIKMPEEVYKSIINGKNYISYQEYVEGAIKNGTPLPKGHKRLIEDNFDAGPVFDTEGNRTGYRYVTREELDSVQTIIPADTENEEG